SSCLFNATTPTQFYTVSLHDALPISPGARWIGARVMERGYGHLSTYLSGLEWCLAPTDTNGLNPRPDLAPDIINNSWGCPRMERSEEHTSELQSRENLVCSLLLEKKK